MPLSPGTRLGRFELLALLGRGGMGEVWRARDPRLSREVALKVLPEQLARDPEWVARFEREARALAALSHPNVAQIFELDEVTGEGGETIRYLVMELVGGRTLRDRLQEGPLAPDEAVEIAVQVGRGLAAAHARGVIHRDLKPANVMLTPDGVAKVLDFGLARIRPVEGATTDTEITLAVSRPGTVLGTASYMSPEQMRGQECGPPCDVWAFGCCLAELLSGRRLFAGATVPEIASKVLSGDVDLSGLPTSASEGLRSLVLDCLAEDPSERPSMEALVARLESGAPSRTLVKRRVLTAGAAVAAVASVAVLAVVAGWFRGGEPSVSDPIPALRVDVVGPGVAQSGLPGRLAAALTGRLTARPGVEVGAVRPELRLEWGIDDRSQPSRLRGELVDVRAGTVVEALTFELPVAASDGDVEKLADAVADRVERAGVIRDLDRIDPLHGFLARRATTLEVARAFQQGVALYGRRRLGEAEARFEAAVSAEPGFWPASLYLAMIDGSTSRFAEGRRRLAGIRASVEQPDAAETTVLEVAQALLDDDNHRLSEALARARERFPSSGELTYRAAWTFRQIREPEKAVPLLQELIDRNWQPDWSPTWVQLGLCQILAARPDEGLATALAGERRFPRNFNLPYVAAVAHAISGRGDEAREAVARAIRKRTDFASSDALAVHAVAAYWCAQVGWPEERKRQLGLLLEEVDRRLIASPDDEGLLGQRADALVGLGRFAEALHILQPRASGTDDPYALITLARATAALGRADEAAGWLRRAGDIWRRGEAPALGTLAYNIACAWAVVGDAAEAVAWLDRAWDQYGFDRIDLTLDPDLAGLRGEGLLERFERRM